MQVLCPGVWYILQIWAGFCGVGTVVDEGQAAEEIPVGLAVVEVTGVDEDGRPAVDKVLAIEVATVEVETTADERGVGGWGHTSSYTSAAQYSLIWL